MEEERRVCSPGHAAMLDNRFRQWLHPRKKIVEPHVRKGDLVLDLGCGPGSFTDVLAEETGATGRVVAVDLQEEMLSAMEHKVTCKNLKDRVTSHPCRADSLMLDDYRGQADFALAFWMVHETADPLRFLREVYEALKPAGRLLCAEPAFHVSRKLYEEMIDQGKSLGFRAEPVRGIRISRAVLFTK